MPNLGNFTIHYFFPLCPLSISFIIKDKKEKWRIFCKYFHSMLTLNTLTDSFTNLMFFRQFLMKMGGQTTAEYTLKSTVYRVYFASKFFTFYLKDWFEVLAFTQRRLLYPIHNGILNPLAVTEARALRVYILRIVFNLP